MDCVEVVEIQGCASDGVAFQPVKIVTEFRKNIVGEIIPYKTRYALADDTIFVLPGGWAVTVGACQLPTPQQRIQTAGTNIASGALAGTHDPQVNGPTWTYPGAGVLQSFTVVALRCGAPASADTITVSFSGSTLWLVQGQSFTWSVAQDPDRREFIVPDFRVDCTGNAAANIGWTEEV